ncbi:hypothetical protein V8D89_006277 [Ganoderma adspersum]
MSVPNGTSKIPVAIIGGGMGGLGLGLCLKKYGPDVHFDIYESAAELTELGAGISMSPRTWSIMKEIGLEEAIFAIMGSQDPGGSSAIFSKGDEEAFIQLLQLPRYHTVQRSAFQQLLAERIGGNERIHFSKRLVSYSESTPDGPITLHFKDGTTATCDLVLGSDGVRSAVRRTMFSEFADEAGRRVQREEAARLREMVQPVFSGQIAHRGLAPTSVLPEDVVNRARTPQILMGKDGDMVVYPVSNGKYLNVLAVKETPGHGRVYDGPWMKPITGEAIADLFEGWKPWALAAFKVAEKTFSWAMHTVPALPTYVKGRVALVGDAAHAMLPHQGSGAGQAFEDGFVLSLVLSHPTVTLANLPEALKIYDDLRRPFSQGVQRGSETNGEIYHMRRVGSGWENITVEDSQAGWYPREWLEDIAEDVREQMRWAIETTIQDDRARLAEMLAALSA